MNVIQELYGNIMSVHAPEVATREVLTLVGWVRRHHKIKIICLPPADRRSAKRCKRPGRATSERLPPSIAAVPASRARRRRRAGHASAADIKRHFRSRLPHGSRPGPRAHYFA